MRNALKEILAGKPVDYTPVAPSYLSLFLADFERNYYIEAYRLRMRGGERYAIDHQEDTEIRAQAIYQSYGIFKSRPDWMEISTGATRSWAERTNIVRQEDVLHYVDICTGLRVPMHAIPLQRGDARLAHVNPSRSDLWDVSAQMQDEDDVDELLPVISADKLLASGEFDLPKRIIADYGELTFLSTILDTPFSDAYALLGFQGLMLTQHDRPKLFHYLLGRQLVVSKEVMQAWATLGLHGVYVEEVFTGADMISPSSYDEFVYLYNQPYFKYMRSLDLLPIHYVCGDVLPRLKRIVTYEVAALAVEESKKNFKIEISDVVAQVGGKTVVFGNIDSVRFGLNGSQAEMAAEVRRQVEIGRQADGFVVSTGSPFPLDTNPRQIDVMVETAHQLQLP
jgi:hypothetical protein